MLIESLDGRIKRFMIRMHKSGKKFLKATDMDTFIKTLGTFQMSLSYPERNLDILITSRYFENISARRTIIKTLEDIDFVRNKNWTEKVAIAYMDEVMSLYLYEGDPDYIKEKESIIARRYNVPISRLKTQLALFLINLENNHDNFHILDYFSEYELVLWKYRDINKLQELIENNKLNEKDQKLLQDLKIIV